VYLNFLHTKGALERGPFSVPPGKYFSAGANWMADFAVGYISSATAHQKENEEHWNWHSKGP